MVFMPSWCCSSTSRAAARSDAIEAVSELRIPMRDSPFSVCVSPSRFDDDLALHVVVDAAVVGVGAGLVEGHLEGAVFREVLRRLPRVVVGRDLVVEVVLVG